MISFGIGVFTIAMSLLVAYGLWNLPSWARILVIVLGGLSLLSNVLTIFGVTSNARGGGNVARSIAGLAVGAYIIYWFYSHPEYFQS
jgi:hypothetical protein